MTGYHLDDRLVDAFTAGTLDPPGQEALAGQVAALLPVHQELPNPTVAALSRIIDRLGDERALLAWLAGHPGQPRLVASVYTLVGLLDQLSDHPPVVAALREIRRQVGLPTALQARLVPDPEGPGTGEETLASLGGQLESMLAEERSADAVRIAIATTDLLQQVLARAARDDPDLAQLSDQLEWVRHTVDDRG